jgi:ribonuclease VapC
VSDFVLDSSAVLAFVNQEPGSQHVAAAMAQGSAISTVNLAEVVTKLNEAGASEAEIRRLLRRPPLDIIDFDEECAYQVGLLRQLTRSAGLSLGDRACLALARRLNLPVLTTDRVWASLQLGITVQVIR